MKHITITLALLLTASQARAQAPAGVVTEDLLSLKRNSLSLALDAGGFFDGVVIERDGQRIDIGFFGGDAGAYFTEKGLAQQSLQMYRTKKIVGLSLWSVGVAALVTDIGLMIHAASDGPRGRGPGGLEWGLLGGGAVAGIAGGVLLQTATGHLFDAVAQHNGTLMDETIDRSLSPSVGVGTNGRGASVSLAVPF